MKNLPRVHNAKADLDFTALELPGVRAHPSPTCLQWTADGQVCFTSKNAAYLFTPDHGINFDTGIVPKSTLAKDALRLEWLRTMIETEKTQPTKWSEFSQSWAAVSFGSIDNAVLCVAISPTGLSPSAGCVVTTLTANMDAVCWMAGKNYLTGEWVKVSELTPFMLQNVSATVDDDEQTLGSILQAQITCLEWTPQVDFGISPTLQLDGSLLILGSRAGYITLLRYHNGIPMELIQTFSVSDQWISRLTFDVWRKTAPGQYEGTLAYAASDGTIGLVKIIQTLAARNQASFTQRYDIEVKVEFDSHRIYEPDNNAGVTSLKWLNISGRSSVLVSSNPGLLKLYSRPNSSATYWTGHRVLRLQTLKISRESSALHPVSGINYLPELDALIVTLFDGSFHIVQNLSSSPTFTQVSSSELIHHTDGGLNSQALSLMSRKMFELSEKGNVNKNDMNRVHGAISYDADAVFMWAYESSRPSDFSYKQDSRQSSTLVVAPLWYASDNAAFLGRLSLLLASAKTSLGLSPFYLLRPYYFHLRDNERLNDCYKDLLHTILPSLHEDHSLRIVVPPWPSKEITDEMKEQFRVSLSTHFFGWDELLSLRMRLSLADFAWKLSKTEAIREQCGAVAQTILDAISQRASRTIIRHLRAVVELLTVNDLPFASRIIVQSMLHGTTQDFNEEGQHLSTLLQPLINSASDTESLPSSGPILGPIVGTRTELPAAIGNLASVLHEICPACGAAIPFQDITRAQCTNGHSWPRCSVTGFILSTPWVRTCVGCCRKAFLPPSALDKTQGQALPHIATSWVVEEVLEAVKKCLFCGNGFVRIL